MASLAESSTMSTAVRNSRIELTDAVLHRLDRPGPRYTSYPTADRFVEAFGPREHVQALRERTTRGAGGGSAALSVYVHIPFCESLCWYCACNKVITRQHDKADEYLQALRQELALHAAALGAAPVVSQLHLGGGTPTFLSDPQLVVLWDILRAALRLDDSAEISVEIDPRTASPHRLGHLRNLGVNRISFGVQDFDPQVQAAVHRLQPFAQVRDLMQAAREIDFESINMDLIYGLPRQSPDSFQRTLGQVIELRPDRIALYAYAHLPVRFKSQRRIAIEQLPLPDQRIRMLGGAMAGFMDAGYEYIGMDHFALPDDALAQARRQGLLHRNFQGYSTQPDCDLLGLGVSAISRIGPTYSQNAKTLDEYYNAVRQGQFAVVRGLALTRDDLIRRTVIMALMCQGRVDFESVELAHLVDMRGYFKHELQALQALEDLGLVVLDGQAIEVTPAGWFGVRAIAMVFDAHLRPEQARERFSRVI